MKWLSKKIIALAAALLFVLPVGAEIEKSSRLVELGFDVSLNVDNNALGLTEIFVDKLIIDLSALADSFDDRGMVINAGASGDFVLNANLFGIGAGLYAGLSGSSYFSIGKGIFDFFGHGNELGEPTITSFSFGLEAFAELGLPVHLKLGKIKLSVTPKYFVPLLYIPNPTATLIVRNTSNGDVVVEGSTTYSIYSVLDLSAGGDDVTNLDFSALLASFTSTDDIASIIMESAGLNLGAQVEYALSNSFDVGGYTAIPLIPGHLNSCSSGAAYFSAQMSSLMGMISGSNEDSELLTMTGPDVASSTFASGVNYSVNQPFRLGAIASWRPFGNWFSITPSIGLAATNPFGEDFDWSSSVYPEYCLAFKARILYVLGLAFQTEYTERVFAQTFALDLNLRVTELSINISSSSASLAKSFTISGLRAKVGLRFGF